MTAAACSSPRRWTSAVESAMSVKTTVVVPAMAALACHGDSHCRPVDGAAQGSDSVEKCGVGGWAGECDGEPTGLVGDAGAGVCVGGQEGGDFDCGREAVCRDGGDVGQDGGESPVSQLGWVETVGD